MTYIVGFCKQGQLPIFLEKGSQTVDRPYLAPSFSLNEAISRIRLFLSINVDYQYAQITLIPYKGGE